MKRRTIGILTLCAVLALLVLNWQTQPFHRLQDRNVVPLSVGIVRSDARGSKTVNLQGSQAVQALQACARRTLGRPHGKGLRPGGRERLPRHRGRGEKRKV